MCVPLPKWCLTCGHRCAANLVRGAATVRPTKKIRAPSVRHIMVFGALPVRPRCGKNDFFVRPQCGNNDFSVRFQCVIMIFGVLPLRNRCIPPSGNVFPMKFTDTAMRKHWPKTNQVRTKVSACNVTWIHAHKLAYAHIFWRAHFAQTVARERRARQRKVVYHPQACAREH